MEEFVPWMLLLLADPAAGAGAPAIERVPGLFASSKACEAAAGQYGARRHACLEAPSDAEKDAAWQALRASLENSR